MTVGDIIEIEEGEKRFFQIRFVIIAHIQVRDKSENKKGDNQIMSNVKKWELNGTFYTTNQLVEMSEVDKSTLSKRLRDGWDVDTAIHTPVQLHKVCPAAPKLYSQGSIDVVFTEYIPGVFREMQPVLNKVYAAEPHCASSHKHKAKLYYIITLDNGKPLIVYPGEFKQVNASAA